MMIKTLRNITGYLPSCAAPVTANLEEKQHVYIWDQYEVAGHIEGAFAITQWRKVTQAAYETNIKWGNGGEVYLDSKLELNVSAGKGPRI